MRVFRYVVSVGLVAALTGCAMEDSRVLARRNNVTYID